MNYKNINPARLSEHINALPVKHDLFYFAKLVAEGLMRDMEPEKQFRYARFSEATMRYLIESQSKEDIGSMCLLYTPFIYLVCRKFPTISSLTFAYLFKQFIHFASTSEPVSAPSADGVASLVKCFLDKVMKT